ncbi:MAG: hypothetical protein ACRC92_04630, partial [Peptostreptococcaceae bacterium]
DLKKAGWAYYCTQNKYIYECLSDTRLNYADAEFFEPLSNKSLLGKFKNLSNFRHESIAVNGGQVNFILSTKCILVNLWNINVPDTSSQDGFLINIPSWVSNALPLDITYTFVVSNFGTCAEVFITRWGIRIYPSSGSPLPSASGSITIPII